MPQELLILSQLELMFSQTFITLMNFAHINYVVPTLRTNAVRERALLCQVPHEITALSVRKRTSVVNHPWPTKGCEPLSSTETRKLQNIFLIHGGTSDRRAECLQIPI